MAFDDLEVIAMSFWDVVYGLWFVFLGMAVCSVIGAAIWESAEEKRRRASALAEQQAERGSEKEDVSPEAEATESEGEQAPGGEEPSESENWDPLG